MGFLSKVFKGVKKTFKKIGKGIKSAFKSIGKFMDKIGIVGQIGLSLLLPGVGAMLGSAFQGFTTAMQAYSGVGSTIINGAGSFLAKAGELAGQMGKSFSSITEGVKNVVGETLKAGANAVGLDTAVLKAGETFGSEYLTKLGTSIGKANLESIGSTFGASVDNVVSSFSNIGKNLGTVPSTSPKLTDGAVTPQPTDVYTPEITTPDMPVASEIKTDSLLAPDASVTPPVVGDPSAVVNRNLSVQAEAGLDPFDREFNPEFSSVENKAMRSGDFSAIKKAADPESFIDKTMRLGKEKLSELPERAMDKLGSTLTDMPSQFARRAAGLDPDPVYNQVSYATVVPTIQEAPMVGSQGRVDPVQYVASNQQSMGLQPFGFNANMYNDATYLTAMRKYGFA